MPYGTSFFTISQTINRTTTDSDQPRPARGPRPNPSRHKSLGGVQLAVRKSSGPFPAGWSKLLTMSNDRHVQR